MTEEWVALRNYSNFSHRSNYQGQTIDRPQVQIISNSINSLQNMKTTMYGTAASRLFHRLHIIFQSALLLEQQFTQVMHNGKE